MTLNPSEQTACRYVAKLVAIKRFEEAERALHAFSRSESISRQATSFYQSIIDAAKARQSSSSFTS